MKSILATVILALAASPSADARDIPQAELSLGGVPIDVTEKQVRALLGAPVSSREEADYLNLHLVYPHVTVSFNGDTVSGLFSTSPKGCTPTGLCPGDPLSRAQELYGSPEISARETGTFWEYYTDCPAGCRCHPKAVRLALSRWPASRSMPPNSSFKPTLLRNAA